MSDVSLSVSRRKLAFASLAAVAGAAVILVVAVLPAEYGVDPLGAGAMFGFSRMSPQAVEDVPPPPPGAQPNAPRIVGPAALYAGAFKTDTAEFTIDPYEYLEYKYDLVKGGSFVFAWQASAPVVHDFHGEPDDNPKNGVQSYDKSTKRGDNGSLVAPFTGIHGWYWENTSGEPVTVKITAAGFFTSSLEFHSDGTKKRHTIAAPDSASNP